MKYQVTILWMLNQPILFLFPKFSNGFCGSVGSFGNIPITCPEDNIWLTPGVSLGECNDSRLLPVGQNYHQCDQNVQMAWHLIHSLQLDPLDGCCAALRAEEAAFPPRFRKINLTVNHILSYGQSLSGERYTSKIRWIPTTCPEDSIWLTAGVSLWYCDSTRQTARRAELSARWPEGADGLACRSFIATSSIDGYCTALRAEEVACPSSFRKINLTVNHILSYGQGISENSNLQKSNDSLHLGRRTTY